MDDIKGGVEMDDHQGAIRRDLHTSWPIKSYSYSTLNHINKNIIRKSFIENRIELFRRSLVTGAEHTYM